MIAAARVQVVPIGEQEVEDAVAAQVVGDLEEQASDVVRVLGITRAVEVTHDVQDHAERVLTVGVADRAFEAQQAVAHVRQRAVVREHQVAPVEHAHERVGVLDRGLSARHLADVRDRQRRRDRVFAHEARQRARKRGVRLEEGARE